MVLGGSSVILDGSGVILDWSRDSSGVVLEWRPRLMETDPVLDSAAPLWVQSGCAGADDC